MKKIFLVIFLFAILFLQSCIKMDSSLLINKDLSMDWVIIFDYTQLNATSQWLLDSSSTKTWSIKTKEKENKWPCDTLESSNDWLSEWNFKETKCINVNKNIAKVIWKWWTVKDLVTKKDWNYILDLNNLVYSNSKDDWKSKEEKIQSINMLKSMWFEMNYNITFPSQIIKSDIWKIDWKKLSFTVYDLIKKDNPKVIFSNIKESQNENSDNNILSKPKLSKPKLFKQLIISKKQLEKTYKWRKDKAKFDKYIPLMKDKKLIDIYNRLDKADLNKVKLRKHKNILEYLHAKIWLEILKRWLN